MHTTRPDLKQIVAHAKSYGFIYPSSEIYGGLQAVYDYGPYGVLLKRRLQSFWWQAMTQLRDDMTGLDAAILMAPRTWEASGHVAGFHDWMVDHHTSRKRYRVDMLLEAHLEQAAHLEKEQKEAILQQMHAHMQAGDGPALTSLLVAHKVACPLAGTAEWLEARQVNLMFATELGAMEGDTTRVYLRPETAQGIFVNFLNVQKSTRKQLPFGIAQIGKAFRNEIIARQFTFRMREFEQMEMQYFIPPGQQEHWFDYWLAERQRWYHALGIPSSRLSIHPHEQLAHYATAAADIQYEFPFGAKEVEGIHSRTDFDLRNHEQYAQKQMKYFDPERGESYLPYVLETSAGSDRLLLMLLFESWRHEEHNGEQRTYLAFPAPLAPIQAAIFPLVRKEPLVSKARELLRGLRTDFQVTYEESGSIGKRYVRQDLIGTPCCITVDYASLEDGCVTVRDRDTTRQERIAIDQVHAYLSERVSMKVLLEKLTG